MPVAILAALLITLIPTAIAALLSAIGIPAWTVWCAASDIEYIRVVVRSLRRNLEANPAPPSLIINDPGVGYRINSAGT